MREIKFRGMHKGGFVSGSLVIIQMPILKEPRPYIVNQFGVWDVDSETIGQYTGLKDKNGKEIYEGDNVHVNMGMSQGANNSFGEWEPAHEISYDRRVEWTRFCGLAFNEGGALLCEDNCKYFEVLGNIYENPELIEAKQLA